MTRDRLLTLLKTGGLLDRLRPVYGPDAANAAVRLRELMEKFAATFPCGGEAETFLFSAPGRTELGGNHTDHQRGRCLAASVDLDTIACVVPNGSRQIRIQSRNHQLVTVDVDDLSVHPGEAEHSASLVRGVAARVASLGYSLSGFDAYTTTRVLRGSGLSSSAAFEVLVGTILNTLFCGGALSSTQIAQIGQYAENVYYGKPCGLMDQLACATGGVIAIDFQDSSAPALRRVQADPAGYGYALCIIDTKGSHAGLTADYAAIPAEMREVAACFGKEVLREVDYGDFLAHLPEVRAACGDRAVLRTLHFFRDNRRVLLQCDALEQGDFETFLRLVNESGRSSFMYLQNAATYRDSRSQPMAVLLALAEELLEGRGACRVHGGGFAGTIQAFVPLDALDRFVRGMEAVSGQGTCHVLRLRSAGAVLLVS